MLDALLAAACAVISALSEHAVVVVSLGVALAAGTAAAQSPFSKPGVNDVDPAFGGATVWLAEALKSGWMTAALLALLTAFFFRLWLAEIRARLAEAQKRADAQERNNEILAKISDVMEDLERNTQQAGHPSPRRRG